MSIHFLLVFHNFLRYLVEHICQKNSFIEPISKSNLGLLHSPKTTGMLRRVNSTAKSAREINSLFLLQRE